VTEQSPGQPPGETEVRVPILAVVGRPNVGKSTLVNRIIGRREAVVEDVPGVTRDRVSYDANWNGRAFTVVDTGGWDPDARGMAERISAQAEIAVTLADAVLFVVDATVGITDADEAVVKILRKSGRPVVLAANKVDDQRTEAEAYGLWNLGLGEPYPVSALHGRGSGDMLDAILAALPETPEESFTPPGGPRRIAIIGRPNVGKSSLLNKLAGEDRVVVDDVSGTTVDPVDELVELGGRTWRFIDTAGIRKRVKTASGHEYYASLRTATAMERAEVAILVIDGSQSISEQDMRIIQTVRDSGRALVIAFNKWDLVDADQHHRAHRLAHRPDRAGARCCARRLGDPGHDRPAQRVPRPPGGRTPTPGPRRSAAEDLVRHPGADVAADVHPVHLGQARRRLRALHRASPARGVRLRGHPDRAAGAAAGEAEALSATPS
jgi:GTPase